MYKVTRVCVFIREVKNKILNLFKTKYNLDNLYVAKPIYFMKINSKEPQNPKDYYWNRHFDKVTISDF